MTKEIIVITQLNQESVRVRWKCLITTGETHITKHNGDFHQLYLVSSKLTKFQVHLLALLPWYPLAKQTTISKNVMQSILHKTESNLDTSMVQVKEE